ncbi:MAG: hypothetical protein K0S10_2723, partial [Rubrobacteraceae bacterium]|nr:hypothetical protein [Rubrobacteraceae bacterium]
RVIAGGHGIPMTGPDTARDLRAFAERFSGSGTGEHGEARGAAARQRTWQRRWTSGITMAPKG